MRIIVALSLVLSFHAYSQDRWELHINDLCSALPEYGAGAGNACFSSANVTVEAFDTENATGVGTANVTGGKVGKIASQADASRMCLSLTE